MSAPEEPLQACVASAAGAYLEELRAEHATAREGVVLQAEHVARLAELIGLAADEMILTDKARRATAEALTAIATYVQRFPPPSHDRTARDARHRVMGLITDMQTGNVDTSAELVKLRARAIALMNAETRRGGSVVPFKGA